MPNMKRNIKDSVFTFLFSDPKYLRELYLYLHPEDIDVREEEFKLITTKNVLSTGQYNDLGIQVRNRLILLMEAQSTFSPNVPLRELMYLGSAFKEYIMENGLSLYSAKAVEIPRVELYVVYTGERDNVPDTLYLSDLWGGNPGSVEAAVKVLRGGDKSILGQYVDFCKISNQQRVLYGLTDTAIRETIRICQEKGVLIPFLSSRRKEVVDIMEMLFSQEEIWEMERRRIAKESKKQGKEESTKFYKEFMKKMRALNRVDEMFDAMDDTAKLEALAKELGIEYQS